MLKYIFFIICQETHKTGWKKVLVTKKKRNRKKNGFTKREKVIEIKRRYNKTVRRKGVRLRSGRLDRLSR